MLPLPQLLLPRPLPLLMLAHSAATADTVVAVPADAPTTAAALQSPFQRTLKRTLPLLPLQPLPLTLLLAPLSRSLSATHSTSPALIDAPHSASVDAPTHRL